MVKIDVAVIIVDSFLSFFPFFFLFFFSSDILVNACKNIVFQFNVYYILNVLQF